MTGGSLLMTMSLSRACETRKDYRPAMDAAGDAETTSFAHIRDVKMEGPTFREELEQKLKTFKLLGSSQISAACQAKATTGCCGRGKIKRDGSA